MENYVVRLAPPDVPKKKDFTFFSKNRLANYIREVSMRIFFMCNKKYKNTRIIYFDLRCCYSSELNQSLLRSNVKV